MARVFVKASYIKDIIMKFNLYCCFIIKRVLNLSIKIDTKRRMINILVIDVEQIETAIINTPVESQT